MGERNIWKVTRFLFLFFYFPSINWDFWINFIVKKFQFENFFKSKCWARGPAVNYRMPLRTKILGNKNQVRQSSILIKNNLGAMLIPIFLPESPLRNRNTGFTQVWYRQKMREIINFLLGHGSSQWTLFPNSQSTGQLCTHRCPATECPQVHTARIIIIRYLLGCQCYKECRCYCKEQVTYGPPCLDGSQLLDRSG